MPEKTIVAPNINCSHCTNTIQRELTELDGVESVDASPESKQVIIRWTDPATWEQIAATLDEIGFPAQG